MADGRIEAMGRGRPPSGALDLGDLLLVPGFIDLQANGVGRVDFATADRVAWRRAGDVLVRHGVTACCPTLVSAPLEEYPRRLAAVAQWRDDALASHTMPAVLGAHLEGPFLGGAPGAHREEVLRIADVASVTALLAAQPGLVRVMTLAPEADPGLAVTRLLVDAGVVVALGHTTASYDEARAATDAGATLVTHLFNGMGSLHHRDPGVAGAALDDERLTPTLIADLVHVHPSVLRLAITRKPNVALVSDVVAATNRVREVDGVARLPDGRIAGAMSLLDEAVANVVGLGFPVERAIELASTVPATVLGLADRGRLEVGACADVVALDPHTLQVRAVWRAGRAV